MRFFSFLHEGRQGLAVGGADGTCRGLTEADALFPGTMDQVIRSATSLAEVARVLSAGRPFEIASVTLLPPLSRPTKIICVGLNYRDHAIESGMQLPEHPALFARFASSLVAHDAPIRRPVESAKLDYEGELVAVIGAGGRRIARSAALDHVAGYSIFNDASIRDFQLRTPQWTMGKNFDGTGAFGPSLVTADELPAGASGLKIETRLNGEVMQSSSTENLIFDVASLVSAISVGVTLEAGDVIVTGTPAGVGGARKPPVFMKAGDVCEVEIEQLGTLRNRVVDDAG